MIEILIGIGVVLIAVGASQRKRISTLFRSEVNAIVEKRTDHLKVASLKIKDKKEAVMTLIDKAGDLMGEEEVQNNQLKNIVSQIDTVTKKASNLKKDGQDEKSKLELTSLLLLRKQKVSIEENINTLKQNRASLEFRIDKMKIQLQNDKIMKIGLDSRKAANNALKVVADTDFAGDSLTDNLSIAEEQILKTESKLNYVTSDDLEDEDYSDDVESEFDKL